MCENSRQEEAEADPDRSNPQHKYRKTEAKHGKIAREAMAGKEVQTLRDTQKQIMRKETEAVIQVEQGEDG